MDRKIQRQVPVIICIRRQHYEIQIVNRHRPNWVEERQGIVQIEIMSATNVFRRAVYRHRQQAHTVAANRPMCTPTIKPLSI